MKHCTSPYHMAREAAGRAVLDAALTNTGGCVAQAALDLGLNRQHVYGLVKRHGLAAKWHIKPKVHGNAAWQALGS